MADSEEMMDTGENSQDQSNQVDRRANRIMKIFGQITECLENAKVARIKEMLSQIIDICKNKEEKPVQELNKIYLEYLLMVEFRAGISVNLIKLSIQSFLMVEDDPDVLGKRVNDMFLEMIITEHPTLALDMKLSDELLKTYFSLLSEGSEPALHMRLMMVGMFGVGKTSLVRRLCHKGVDDVKSTEVIDIFMESCEVKEDGDWIISPDKEREQVFNIRLQTLLERQKKKQEVKQTAYEIVYDREQTTNEHTKTRSDQGQKNDSVMDIEQNVKFEEFSSKVDEKDLRQRSVVETTKEVLRRPTISLWDFAGQSVYYSTHHFFLNDRSIYLLVLDLSKELDDVAKEDTSTKYLRNFMVGNDTTFTCREAFKFWIKSIYIYTKQKKVHSSASQRTEYSPKILLIGTHKDAITEAQLNDRSYEQYKDDYFDQALKSFTERPMANLIHKRKFLVNNLSPTSEDMKEFFEIKKEIFKIAREETPFLDEPIPAKFIPLERSVFYSKRDNMKIMKFEELQEENRKIEFPSKENEIKLFLAFQHAFGNVIYFNTGTLHDTVILTPQWILNVLKAFVSHKTDKNPPDVGKWADFRDRGILRDKLIDELLKPHEELYPVKAQIISYMEHMDVIVRPVIFKGRQEGPENDIGQSSHSICQIIEDFYIMPCMLPRMPSVEEMKSYFKLSDGESQTPTLCLYFKQCFLPPFVVHCLLASFVKKMEIKTLNGQKILYSGLGSFSFKTNEDSYLTLWAFDDILHFKITFTDQLDPKEMTRCCLFWRGEIERLVLEIFNFHGKDTYSHEDYSTLFEYRIKCPKCKEQMPCEQKVDSYNQPCDYMCCLFNILDLIERKQRNKKCSLCGETTASEELLRNWFGVYEEVSGIDDCLLEFPQEDKLADLSEEISEKLTRRLAVELCIKEKDVERLEASKAPAACFPYRVLYLWKKRYESWNVLYKALPRARIEIKDDVFFRIIKGEESKELLNQMTNIMNLIEDVSVQIDESLLPRLAEHVGDEFWLLGVRLGIKDPAIQRIMVSCKDDCDKVCWEILKKWRLGIAANFDPVTRLKHLIKAMIKSGTDMPEIVEVLQTANQDT